MRHPALRSVFLSAALVATLTGCDGSDGGGRGSRCNENADCESDLYCEKPSGLCAADGTCEVRPDACPAVEAPVCGCDGVTWGNSCIAAGEGVSVKSIGPCP